MYIELDSKRSVPREEWKYKTEKGANSVDLDQMPQNAASDQRLSYSAYFRHGNS